MGIKSFKSHTGLLAVLDRSNIDTDQIIPKQFLKSIRKTGYGENLFFDWRFLPDGALNPQFELNLPRYRGASILVTGNNFGCGSSREHAVWALVQYGFCAVIAPRSGNMPAYADIFRNNSVKNGLLTLELKDEEVAEIIQMAARYEGLKGEVNLEEQRVTLHLPEEISFHFDIDPVVKDHLVSGLDEISMTEKYLPDIESFEKKHDMQI